jgi:hypothetical protein
MKHLKDLLENYILDLIIDIDQQILELQRRRINLINIYKQTSEEKSDAD